MKANHYVAKVLKWGNPEVTEYLDGVGTTATA